MSKSKQKSEDSRVSHGICFWLDNKRINPSIRGYRKLQQYLRDMEKNLIELQGGPEKLTAAKEILIKATIEAYGVLLLASIYCKREGIIRPDMLKKGIVELQPVLGRQFLAFLNTLRQNLLALGLDSKKADEALDLKTYVAETYGSKEKEDETDNRND